MLVCCKLKLDQRFFHCSDTLSVLQNVNRLVATYTFLIVYMRALNPCCAVKKTILLPYTIKSLHDKIKTPSVQQSTQFFYLSESKK